MKKLIYTIISVSAFFNLLNAQGVPNPSFELWDSLTQESPSGWFNSNSWALGQFGTPNVTRTTDAHTGYALRLETFMNAGSDTAFGYISQVDGDPLSVPGGQPYSQQPDSIRGWMKYNIMPGDTGLLLVVFKNGGSIISTDIYTITGSAAAYTYFSFALSLGATPDTVVIAAASSNGINNLGIADGSVLFLDDITFNTSDPVYNGDFETWDVFTRREPTSWNSMDFYGDTTLTVIRTTDAITGMYAARIETRELFGGGDTTGFLTTGMFDSSGIRGGNPYTIMVDTLCGFYKCAPQGGDSAVIGAVFSSGGSVFYVAAKRFGLQASYTYFEIPFSLPMTPDTVRIDIWPSDPGLSQTEGSVIIVDSLRFKSDPLTGRPAAPKNMPWVLFPNPASDFIWLEALPESSGEYSLTFLAMQGTVVHHELVHLNKGLNRVKINTSAFASGLYIVQLKGSGYSSTGKIVIE